MPDDIRVYLDTNIITCIYDNDFNEEDIEALDWMTEQEFIKYETSKKAKDELLKMQNHAKRVLFKLLYVFIKKVPWTKTDKGIFDPAIFDPQIFDTASMNENLVKLKYIFDGNDAEHIFEAGEAKCAYFLTLDNRTILKRAKKHRDQINKIYPDLNFVSPADLHEILTT